MNSIKSVEVFKDISGFPNYEVSNYGKVFRKQIEVLKYINEKPTLVKNIRRRLFGSIRNRCKYVVLTKENGKTKCIDIKYLVADAFLEPKGKEFKLEHIDGDTLNNFSTNLHYVECKLKQRTIKDEDRIEVSDEIQNTWDLCLLTGWKNNWSLKRIVRNFCLIENPSIVFTEKKYFDWFYQLKLKRTGEQYEIYIKDAKAFIGDHSPKLSSCLFSNDVEDCLKSINNFPWLNCVPNIFNPNKPALARYTVGGRKFSESEWGHVK